MINDKIFSIDEYDFKFEGIKGVLKRSASDFKVNEIDFNDNMIDFQRVTKDDMLEKNWNVSLDRYLEKKYRSWKNDFSSLRLFWSK